MPKLKKIFISAFIFSIFVLPSFSVILAAPADPTADNFEIIPKGNEADISSAIQKVGNEGGKVWENYNEQAKNLSSKGGGAEAVGSQLASGIMTWDTLLDYATYLVNFLSQVGLLIGGLMIVYAGYMYATTIFGGGDATKGNNAIKYAIMGILVVIFSYAIMRLLTRAFLT
ncbi:MAG: hypothetical protein WC872_01000 [Candidatus Absconditabacterales bacterium]